MLRRKLKNKDGDAALREDIRLLGRLLGDTSASRRAASVFDLVESIRRTAIHYRREHDPPSLKQLERTIGRLGPAHATNVVRAFSYFHHLANIAEDLHAPPASHAATRGEHRRRAGAAARRRASRPRKVIARSSSGRASSRC